MVSTTKRNPTKAERATKLAGHSGLCGNTKCTRDVEDGICCDICEKWFHQKCSKLTVRYYGMLKENKPLPWVCTACVTRGKKLLQQETHEETKSGTNTRSVGIDSSRNTAEVSTQSVDGQARVPTTNAESQTRPNWTPTRKNATTKRNCGILTTSTLETGTSTLANPVAPNNVDKVPEIPPTETINLDSAPAEQLSTGQPPAQAVTVLAQRVRAKTQDKATATPREVHGAGPSSTSVIIFNLDESDSPSLAERENHDTRMFKELCAKLSIPDLEPAGLRRLVKSRDKRFANCPRLLKVSLKSEHETGRLLTSAATLKGCTEVRVRPDLPRSIRRDPTRLAGPGSAGTHPWQRSIVIHGVPEAQSDDPQNRLKHDLDQWHYIASKLNISGLVTCSANRLPRPPHLTHIAQPKLLRVTLLSEPMAQDALEKWFTIRRTFPSDLHLHRCRPRTERQALRSDNPATDTQPVLSLTDISLSTAESHNLVPSQKNSSKPAPQELAA